MSQQIEFADTSGMAADVQEMFEEADRSGAPNSNLLRVLAHRPPIMKGFFEIWTKTFNEGALDHRLKEIVRVKVADLYHCGY